MLSKADKYRQMIQKATKRMMLFSNSNNQEKKSTGTSECDIKLPSSHPFRSSQQIENNIPINHQITHQSQQQYPTSLHNNWPKPCIGLVLCQHHQNNQTYYVYGTGILIHRKIVLTSAQNVYCRRLNTQYTNVRFIIGVSGDKCSGIYDIMRVHYPKEYTMQENYNFAVLQLYDDLTNSCGYVGWKTSENIQVDDKYTVYGYISGNQQGSFNLIQISKHKKQQQYVKRCLGSGVLIKENKDKYQMVGLQQSEKKYVLSEKIRNMINQWTHFTTINLAQNNIGSQVCKYLSQAHWTHFIKIHLQESNNIGAQACKYLSQANWTHLTLINLDGNNIGAQGCKYLSQANWKHLTQIYLYDNNIDAQGCKYLSQTNWTHLTKIHLWANNVGGQGCKYLSQANWPHLISINLQRNNVGAQGCKNLSQANWIHLIQMNLNNNSIYASGCKYLSQANWTHLIQIKLWLNQIGGQGCRYLSQANWIHLTTIILAQNNIGSQGYKYLTQVNWKHLKKINLQITFKVKFIDYCYNNHIRTFKYTYDVPFINKINQNSYHYTVYID